MPVFYDKDGDGYGNPHITRVQCYAGSGYVLNDTDCHDGRPDINPTGQEVCDDPKLVELEGVSFDEDCDGLYDDDDPSVDTEGLEFYLDDDGDGYGDPDVTIPACEPPRGFVANAEDCDDELLTVNPEGIELCADELDNDCDSLVDADDPDARDVDWFTDGDLDGYGLPDTYQFTACSADPGYAPNDDDCDDADSAVNPGAAETWYDGTDQDCDGASDFDADADGYDASSVGGDDCQDADPEVSPGALEVCDDAQDNDCDGFVDPCDVSGRLEAEVSGDEAGYALSVSGDIDGDGLLDILIGAPYQDSGAIGAGAAYIVAGTTTSVAPLSGFARLDGAAVGEAAGWSVDAGADVDGDGYDDIIVGPTGWTPPRERSAAPTCAPGRSPAAAT